MRTELLFTIALQSCVPLQVTNSSCSWVCVAEGVGATVEHCGRSLFSASECRGPVYTRPAIDGEIVEVRAYRGSYFGTVDRANLEGFIALERIARPGDSGSGVFGADGALLGLVDRNQGDWTIVIKPPKPDYSSE